MSETKELVEFLDGLQEWTKTPMGALVPISSYWSDRDFLLLTEIKGILEQQALPDEKLVEKIVEIYIKYIQSFEFVSPVRVGERIPDLNNELKDKLLSLLQSQKPVITIAELKQFLQIKQIPESAIDTRLLALANLFKSKGFDVRDK